MPLSLTALQSRGQQPPAPPNLWAALRYIFCSLCPSNTSVMNSVYHIPCLKYLEWFLFSRLKRLLIRHPIGSCLESEADKKLNSHLPHFSNSKIMQALTEHSHGNSTRKTKPCGNTKMILKPGATHAANCSHSGFVIKSDVSGVLRHPQRQ